MKNKYDLSKEKGRGTLKTEVERQNRKFSQKYMQLSVAGAKYVYVEVVREGTVGNRGIVCAKLRHFNFILKTIG